MKILIPIIPHSTRHDKGMSKGFSNANFPLGVAYIVAAIIKKFPESEILTAPFDIMQVDDADEIKNELTIISKGFSPDFIIYGAMITRFHYIVTLSRISKTIFPDALQILGGSSATWGYYLFEKEAPIDFITVGEAEETIVSILSENYQNTPGVLWLDSTGTYRGGATKQLIKNLDDIPIPNHSSFLVKEYIEIQKRITGWKTMPMVASRGCPFLCQFCSPSANSLRIRSVSNVIEEMRFLKSNYGIDSIYFWDELQFVKKPWFEEFCRQMIIENIGLKWVFVTRATLVREKDIPLLKLARKAGCVRIAIGIESGSELILNAMNKKTSVQEMSDALWRVRRAGIKATGSMLLGMPGENKSTIQASIDFANKNLLETSFYNLIPLAGAEVYDNYCKSRNLIPDEKEYAYKVSLAGGDASNIIMNLTELDDATYISETTRANNSVKKISVKSALKYYGLMAGINYTFNRRLSSIKRKLSGRTFDTP